MFIQEASVQTDNSGRFRLYPIGDMHCDRSAFQKKRFQRWRDLICRDPHGVAVFVGDAVEGRTPGMKHFNTGSLSNPFRLNMENYVDFALNVVASHLRPITEAGRPLFVVKGNHDAYMQWSGFTPALSRMIGAKYLDGAGLIRLISEGPKPPKNRPGQRTAVTTIYATHGFGGGRTPGPKMNSLTRLTDVARADIYVCGHTHDQLNRVIHIPYIKPKGELKILRRPVGFLRAPAFLDQAEENVSGYDQDKAFPATDAGLFYLDVQPQENRMTRVEAPF